MQVVSNTSPHSALAAAQREELEQEIAGLEKEAERVAKEARELTGEVPF